MKTRGMNYKVKGVGFAGACALLAMIGLIVFSPLTASGQGALSENEARGAEAAGACDLGAFHAGPRFGPGGEGIEFFRIALDLTDDQAREMEPILEEHHDKMMKLREGGIGGRRAEMRMNRMHRHNRCDRVDRTEMRANMRRQRREMEKDREKIRKRIDRGREDLDKKLSRVLDKDQMRKFRELRELRESRRHDRRDARRHDRLEHRGDRHGRGGKRT
jgi:hypothetical protein